MDKKVEDNTGIDENNNCVLIMVIFIEIEKIACFSHVFLFFISINRSYRYFMNDYLVIFFQG